jgi:hypothetical protein
VTRGSAVRMHVTVTDLRSYILADERVSCDAFTSSNLTRATSYLTAHEMYAANDAIRTKWLHLTPIYRIHVLLSTIQHFGKNDSLQKPFTRAVHMLYPKKVLE